MKITTRHDWLPSFYDECKTKFLLWSELQIQRPSGTVGVLRISQPVGSEIGTIVFLHGFGNDLIFPHVGLFRSLLSAGWNVVSGDIDGHGKGESSLFDPLTVQDNANSLISMVEDLQSSSVPLHLIGFSLGAGILAKYASENSRKVASLTLIAMPLELPRFLPIIHESLSGARKVFFKAMSDYGVYGVLPALGSFKRSSFPIRFRPEWGNSNIEAARIAFKQLSPRKCLGAVECPTLFIGGTRDFLAPISSVKELGIPLSKVGILEVPDETHFTTMLSPVAWQGVVNFLKNPGLLP